MYVQQGAPPASCRVCDLAKYVDKTYALFSGKFGATPEGPMPLAWWRDYFSKSGEEGVPDPTDEDDEVV